MNVKILVGIEGLTVKKYKIHADFNRKSILLNYYSQASMLFLLKKFN
ncbi:hypothetical protein [Ferdinandcohnia sp. SAFN-114]